jgi:integrase/recombinase XerD
MLKHIDKDVVIGFLNWIEQDRGCSTSSRNVRLAALHSFFRYLQYRDPADIYTWQSILAIPVKKTVKPSIYYLTIEGVRLIFAEPDLTTQSGRRDLAMLALLYDSGCRVQELIDLRPSMVRLESPSTVKLIGNGKPEITIHYLSGCERGKFGGFACAPTLYAAVLERRTNHQGAVKCLPT